MGLQPVWIHCGLLFPIVYDAIMVVTKMMCDKIVCHVKQFWEDHISRFKVPFLKTLVSSQRGEKRFAKSLSRQRSFCFLKTSLHHIPSDFVTGIISSFIFRIVFGFLWDRCGFIAAYPDHVSEENWIFRGRACLCLSSSVFPICRHKVRVMSQFELSGCCCDVWVMIGHGQVGWLVNGPMSWWSLAVSAAMRPECLGFQWHKSGGSVFVKAGCVDQIYNDPFPMMASYSNI